MPRARSLCAAVHPAFSRSAGGHGQNTDIAAVLADHAGGGNGLIGNRPLVGNHDRAIRARLAQPVGAINRALTECIVDAFCRLLQLFRCQAQIDRSAGFIAEPRAFVRIALAVALHVVERPFHDHGQFVGKGGLEAGKTVLGHAGERRADRLVGAAFRCQRHAGGRTGNHEPGVLIAGIIQRIEAPVHERIVDGSDRDDPLAPKAVGKPGRSQKQEQVHFRNAKFQMLTFGGEVPFGGRRDPGAR